MSEYILNFYPENHSDDSVMYYVEFSSYKASEPMVWRLFQRSFICSKEEWEEHYKTLDEFSRSIMSREGHPYQLGSGSVNEQEYCVDMNTRRFLKFMVDSLNKNCKPK